MSNDFPQPVPASPDPSADDALRQAIHRHLLALDDADPGFLADLIESYIATTPEIIEALERDRQEGDAEGMHAGAHSLKSSSQILGLFQLSSLCMALEASALEAPTGPDTDRYVARIGREYQRVAGTLNTLLQHFRKLEAQEP